jgi:hypothetical protein
VAVTSKTFEIRDRATFIPVLAVKLNPVTHSDRYLFGCAGYGLLPQDQERYVYLCRVAGGTGKSTSDPFDWADRTLQIAHQYIVDHWDELASGAVVDVEHILGETTTPKQSEQWTTGSL